MPHLSIRAEKPLWQQNSLPGGFFLCGEILQKTLDSTAGFLYNLYDKT
jgi:ADP-ribose pyrophosphatase YjhB (NUDIX family)